MIDIVSYSIGASSSGGLPTEQKVVDLSMPTGDQVIDPDSGHVMSSVTVTKPATMLPENIKDGINIGGVLGTLSGGGGDDGSFKGVIERSATNPTLPSDLTRIGDYAFDGCSNLALTSLPDGVRSIGLFAFDGCKKLALTSLPSGVSYIGQYAFRNCWEISLTSLPNGIDSFEDSCFAACENLAITSLPSNVSMIGRSAFSGCSNISISYIPGSVWYIKDYAFGSCTGITSITFGGTPKGVFTDAFWKCQNLTSINVPWSQDAVEGAPWGATNATINYNYAG